MKISKSILQAIFVGVTIGATTSSCSLLDSVTGPEEEICEEDCRIDHLHTRTAEPDNTCWDCPACGMG